MSGLGRWLAVLFFPDCCCLCGEVTRPGKYLCHRCGREAPFVLPPVCDRCGRGEDRCSCGGHRRLFERCVSPFYYEGAVHTGIGGLKNEGWHSAIEGFTAEMAELVRREYGGIPFAGVVPVPLHRRERRRRGFEPVGMLARRLAERLGVPYLPVLCKLIHTAPQKELSAARRSGNLLGAFDVTAPEQVEDRVLLLVDDVMTTGSTLDECAKMLKINGAKEVYAITAACAVLKKDGDRV